MDIFFTSDRMERELTTDQQRVSTFGPAAAKKIRLRLSQLSAAPDLQTMRSLPGRCHELRGDRAGQMAVEVSGGLRLVFAPAHDPVPLKPDGGLDWTSTRAIRILEVTNYHD